MRKIIVILLILMITTLTACGVLSNAKVSTIYVDRKGEVVSATIASLPTEQYDGDELKVSIDEAIATYNSTKENEPISLNEFKVKKEQATLRLTYATAGDYEAFNERTLFAGTIAEATAAGYDFEVDFIDSDKTTIKGSAILKEARDELVIITNEPVQIQTTKDILYTSDNATIIDKRTAQVEDEAGSTDNGITFGNAKVAYVIYGEPNQ